MKAIRLTLLFLALVITAVSQDIPPYDALLSSYKYPYPVKFYTVQNQGQSLRMAYMDVKPARPNGKTILLLHGKNFNGAYWDSTAALLMEKGYRVIMPDQIGFGKSSKPANFQYTFQQLAQNTKALLDAAGVQQTIVLGHSMGGMLATRFALMYPAFTEKLILENPIGLEDWKTVVPYQSVDQWYKSEMTQHYGKIKKYQMENYYAGQWNDTYDKWAKLLAGWTTHKDYPKVAWNAALTYDMVFTQPVVYEFPNLKMPVLLIIGQRDRTALGKANAPEGEKEKLGNYPELGKKTKAAIPNAQLAELDNVGHLPHIEAFPRFIKALEDFLQ